MSCGDRPAVTCSPLWCNTFFIAGSITLLYLKQKRNKSTWTFYLNLHISHTCTSKPFAKNSTSQPICINHKHWLYGKWCKMLQVLFEPTRKMKNQHAILLFALFPYKNVPFERDLLYSDRLNETYCIVTVWTRLIV